MPKTHEEIVLSDDKLRNTLYTKEEYKKEYQKLYSQNYWSEEEIKELIQKSIQDWKDIGEYSESEGKPTDYISRVYKDLLISLGIKK